MLQMKSSLLALSLVVVVVAIVMYAINTDHGCGQSMSRDMAADVALTYASETLVSFGEGQVPVIVSETFDPEMKWWRFEVGAGECVLLIVIDDCGAADVSGAKGCAFLKGS